MMSKFVRIDLLGGKNMPCHDCGNQFGIHWAANGGLSPHPICFKCIMLWIDEENYVVD